MPDFHGPPLLERLTQQLAAQGHVKDPTAMAQALLRARGQMTADGRLTPAGEARDKLGAEGRAKDRAAKRTGKPTSQFTYDPKTNAATRRR